MPLFRSKAEDKVREAGFDPARLPPGQYFTEKWPVLHAGEVPDVDLATWTLEVTGEVEQPLSLSFDELRALPSDRGDERHPLRHPLEPLRRAVQGRALARARDALPAEAERELRDRPRRGGLHGERADAALEDEHALVVYEADGEPLTPEHGWPVRLFIPTKYFWKSAKWLRGIELSAVDKPGFWERYGYHNDADFWKEERYAF